MEDLKAYIATLRFSISKEMREEAIFISPIIEDYPQK